MTSTLEFYVDIEDSSGTRQGSGPITSASSWRYTARMDRAGTFAFSMPATDPMAAEVTKKRTARAWAKLGSTWTEIGAGIIDRIEKTPQADGSVLLTVSGDSEERELTYRSVGFAKLSNYGSPISHLLAVQGIFLFAPSGWTYNQDPSPGNENIYGQFAGESVLSAVVRIAKVSQTHWYRSGSKEITFASTFTDSGVRAIKAGGVLVDETCAITGLREQIDTYGLITRIYPRGSGQGQAELTLAATSRTAGAGYTLDAANNYIKNDTAEASYGRIEKTIPFKDITPINNTSLDLQSAANALYDAALEELTRRSTDLEQATYTLQIAQCSTLLRPMQTIRLVYRDDDADIDIDTDLNILEATIQVDADGLRTTGLVVSTADRWPQGDSEIIADNMEQGTIFQAHPQLNGNSYWENATLFVGDDQTSHVAEFPFVFGDEVAQIQQVVFRFAIEQLLAFSNTVGGDAEVDVDVDSVSVSGTIDISHTHTIPDHQHFFTISGNLSPTYPVGFGAAGTAGGLVHNASASDFDYPTNADSGSVTSESGGSETLALSGTGSGSGTVDLSSAISNEYGLYRESSGNTYAITDLEYRVNGGDWADLDDASSVGGSYYELDITADVSSSTTFRPNQENNLIEIRRTTAAGTGKTAMILAKLGVRNIIQSIAYT